MNEQKRLILAVVLSVVVLFAWNMLFPPQKTEPTRPDITNSIPQDQNKQNITDYQSSSTASVQPNSSSPQEMQPAEYKSYTISTPLYDAVLSEDQATIKSLTLKNYKENLTEDSPLKEIISQELQRGLFGMTLDGMGITGFENAVFQPEEPLGQTVILTNGEKIIPFVWKTPDGIVIQKILTFSASSYLINCDLVLQNGSGRSLRGGLAISMAQYQEKEAAKFAFEGPIAFINKELQEIKPKDIEDKNTYHGTVEWAGYTDRYFLKMIIPKTPLESVVRLSNAQNIITTSLVTPIEGIDPGKQANYSFDLYMGPKSLKILSEYSDSISKAINFGWFTILAKPLLMGMNYIYTVIPNYGVAIIILTILIKLLFWPLGTKSYKSMNEMKKVQPLMMEIREKYKNDKQKMNQETMALYKTYKVNPAGGCLPMLVQMPIFFALYRMLYQAIELRHAPFIGWIKDLSAPDRLFHFDFTIPMLQEPTGIPILTLLMGASFLLQQKMSPATGDPTQARMMMLMPLFMTVLFINFSSGLVLYMFVNNIISMGQQYYIQKKFA